MALRVLIVHVEYDLEAGRGGRCLEEDNFQACELTCAHLSLQPTLWSIVLLGALQLRSFSRLAHWVIVHQRSVLVVQK